MNNKFKSIFYPSNDVLDALSLKVKTQLPIIIVGALVCILMFILFGITNLFSAPYLSVFSLVTVSIFGLAIILIKKGKIMRGVQAVSIGFLFACIMISFFALFIIFKMLSSIFGAEIKGEEFNTCDFINAFFII